jgi:SAM-dependent methyltransferase
MDHTTAILAKHHRSPAFAETMVTTHAGRFNHEFWQFWQDHIHPSLSAAPCLLDLGTGPGLALQAWAERYPEARLIGVEVMPYMLEKARQILTEVPQAELIHTDLHNPELKLEINTVDAAQAVVVLHEMVQPIRLLQAAFRGLKPGGRLLIVDWVRAPIRLYFDPETADQLLNPDTNPEVLEDAFTHFFEHNRYTVDDLLWLLERVGFEILAFQSYNQHRFVRIAAAKPR